MSVSRIAFAPLLAMAALGALTQGASAADDQNRRVLGSDPGAKDIVRTPLDDLNIDTKDVPPALAAAERAPYAVPRSCAVLTREMHGLNATLGPDYGTMVHGQRLGAGAVAQGIVGSLIPFGGIVKEITGAAAKQRRLQVAIYAGLARRGFLRGYGMSHGCLK